MAGFNDMSGFRIVTLANNEGVGVDGPVSMSLLDIGRSSSIPSLATLSLVMGDGALMRY